MKTMFLMLTLALASVAWAQDEMPAVNTEEPAVSTEKTVPDRPAPPRSAPSPSPEAPGQTVHKATSGTTVVGEKDSPIGLYITPWRNSSADGGLDRPARLLDEALMPLDQEVFKRQVLFNRALTEHLEKSGRATP
jgi:hypothetical protein